MRLNNGYGPISELIMWPNKLDEHPQIKSGIEYSVVHPHCDIEMLRKKYPFYSMFFCNTNNYGTLFYSFLDSVNNAWPEFSQTMRNNAFLLTQPFEDAIIRSLDALFIQDNLESLRGKILTGCVFRPNKWCELYELQVPNSDDASYKLRLITFGRSGALLHLLWDGIKYNQIEGFSEFNKLEELPEIDLMAVKSIIARHLFLKYADVERRAAKLDSPIQFTSGKSVPYKITQLDCSWYTTIIRSEGFGVKGHFRMQPYGISREDRKLIYIKPYQKQGYTRRAKISNQNTF